MNIFLICYVGLVALFVGKVIADWIEVGGVSNTDSFTESEGFDDEDGFSSSSSMFDEISSSSSMFDEISSSSSMFEDDSPVRGMWDATSMYYSLMHDDSIDGFDDDVFSSSSSDLFDDSMSSSSFSSFDD